MLNGIWNESDFMITSATSCAEVARESATVPPANPAVTIAATNARRIAVERRIKRLWCWSNRMVWSKFGLA